MFEPPILDQLMGVGALLIGFAELCRHIKLQEERKEKERREEQEFASMIIQGYNHAYERTNGKKFARIFSETSKDLPTTTNRPKDCVLNLWHCQSLKYTF